MTRGELNGAVRRALNLFDAWNNVTGALAPGSSWYYEVQGVIEDAVHCGAQAATGDFRRLDTETDVTLDNLIPRKRPDAPPGLETP